MSRIVPRGKITLILWRVTCLFWVLLLFQQAADVERFSGNWILTVLRCLPLLLFILVWRRDSLTGLIWFELILLFYFISTVEASFAYQGDILSILGLVLVVILFTACMFYIRFRGRENRLSV